MEFEAATAVELHQPPEMEHLFIINNEFLYMHQHFSFNFSAVVVVFFFSFLNLSSVFFVSLQNSVTFPFNEILSLRLQNNGTMKPAERRKNASYFLIQPFHPKYCLTYDNDSWPCISLSRSWLCMSWLQFSSVNKCNVKCFFICF